MILIACLIVYLFGRADQVFFSESITVESRAMRWTAVAVHTVQILLLYVLLPLIAIHLWIATARKAWRRRSRGSNASDARPCAPIAADLRGDLRRIRRDRLFTVVQNYLFQKRMDRALGRRNQDRSGAVADVHRLAADARFDSGIDARRQMTEA